MDYPEDFNITRGNIEDIKVDSVEQSEQIIMTILDGKQSTARNIAILNAGAAIYISGLTKDIGSGVNKAVEVIDNGSAMNKLNELIKNSKEYD